MLVCKADTSCIFSNIYYTMWCVSEYMQCLKDACFSYFQLGGKCVDGPVALLSVWVLLTYFHVYYFHLLISVLIYNYLFPQTRRLCFTLHLFLCLLATSCKNYWSGLHENFARDYLWTKKNSGSGSRSRNILKHSLTLQDSAFFCSLAYISGRNPAPYFPTFRNCKNKIQTVAHWTQYNGSDSCIVYLHLYICLLLQIGS